MTPQPKPKRELDSEYLKFVRSKPCCLREAMYCEGPLQAHHVSPRNGTKGMGSKVSDRRTVPVCQRAHDYCEANPKQALPFLEKQIQKLNLEYDRLHPKERKTRKKAMKINLAIHNCEACGRNHLASLDGFGLNAKLDITCKLKNKRFTVEI